MRVTVSETGSIAGVAVSISHRSTDPAGVFREQGGPLSQRRFRYSPSMLVRFVRLRDAPQYFGMDRNRFNRDVRPYLTEIPIGAQGVAFDRLEMDVWDNEYKLKNGKPPRRVIMSRSELTDTKDSSFNEIAKKVVQERGKR